jgi:hypothetical protein
MSPRSKQSPASWTVGPLAGRGDSRTRGCLTPEAATGASWLLWAESKQKRVRSNWGQRRLLWIRDSGGLGVGRGVATVWLWGASTYSATADCSSSLEVSGGGRRGTQRGGKNCSDSFWFRFSSLWGCFSADADGVVSGQVVLLRARVWEIASAPPRPIMASARLPAAPMPASPQSNPWLGATTRTTVAGAFGLPWPRP